MNKGDLVRFTGQKSHVGISGTDIFTKLKTGDLGIYQRVFQYDPDCNSLLEEDFHMVYWQRLGTTVGTFSNEIELVQKGE